jgi:hypothetical protein
MTLVGVFKCRDGAVLLADGQETIPDYAKFTVEKIKLYWGEGFRVLMTASGDSDPIEMLWDCCRQQIKSTGKSDSDALKAVIVRTVATVTKSSFVPLGRGRPLVDAIWAIQQEEPGLDSIVLFRTRDLLVNSISDPPEPPYYFTGNPQLLAHYLSDWYFRNVGSFCVSEAEALAAFMLWEAKTYDPYCGKQSDIITLTVDGEIRWMFRQMADYWEEHFALLKKSQRFMPLLSCGGGPRIEGFSHEQLEGFAETVRFLASEQHRKRLGGGAPVSLEGKLINHLAKKKKAKQSGSRKSKNHEGHNAQTNYPKENQPGKKKTTEKEHGDDGD